jgi:hypothetical protein
MEKVLTLNLAERHGISMINWHSSGNMSLYKALYYVEIMSAPLVVTSSIIYAGACLCD